VLGITDVNYVLSGRSLAIVDSPLKILKSSKKSWRALIWGFDFGWRSGSPLQFS
jgi:hypothetical protein